MSEVKHTPGPWGINQSADEGAWDIGTGEWQGDSYGGLQIATAWGFYGQAEANARLIAAAPELLEVLKEALSLMRGEPDMSLPGSDHWLWAESASAAIAIAEGERA